MTQSNQREVRGLDKGAGTESNGMQFGTGDWSIEFFFFLSDWRMKVEVSGTEKRNKRSRKAQPRQTRVCSGQKGHLNLLSVRLRAADHYFDPSKQGQTTKKRQREGLRERARLGIWIPLLAASSCKNITTYNTVFTIIFQISTI